jgi:dienelactone hydrolase
VPALPPIDATCPLVVFSHGNSGYREQSTFLTTQLARAGFVVAAPDHVGNTFPEMLALEGETARQALHRTIRRQRPLDLLGVVRALLDGDAGPAEPVRATPLPRLDPTRAGALGHSFGGWSALKLAALEPRIRGICALAPVAEPFVGRGAFLPGELPLPDGVRSLVLAARDDVLVDLETSLLPLFERLGPDAALEILDDTDHFHFCDGIELLHAMHEKNPRPGQRRPTRPFGELRGERETQTLVAHHALEFFERHLRRGSAA